MYGGVDYTRHASFFNPVDNGKVPVIIIGAGAIGSFVALTLAKIGFLNISVFDEDEIDQVNIPNQFYPLDSIGKKKVEVLVEEVLRYTGVGVVGNPVRFLDQPIPESAIVISCVDSMTSREIVYAQCRKVGFSNMLGMIDSRMAGTVYRIYTVNKDSHDKYMDFWYPDSVATMERCTEKSVIFNVCGISSMVCSQAVKLAKGEPLEFELFGDFKWHTHAIGKQEELVEEEVNQ